MADMKVYRDAIFKVVHRGGEEMNNNLPNWLERAVKDEVWKQVIDPATGKPFADVGRWLTVNWPLGPGVGIGEFAVSYDQCIKLCERKPGVKDLLTKHRPKRQGKRTDLVDIINEEERRPTGTSRAYIEQRLQREFPDIWQAYLNNEYRSARAAAIAAGFIKDDGHDPLKRLKNYWAKATAKQRREFLAWIEQQRRH